MKPDYYELLGVRPEATAAEIKKSFRGLAKRFHPDRNPGQADAEERFKLINEAYDHLRDPEKRARYDRYVNRLQKKKASRRPAAWYDDFYPVDDELGDFVRGFYGSRSSAGRRRPSKGTDVRLNLKVAFDESVLGCVKEIRVPIMVACPRCGGTGIPAAARQKRCTQCHGTGRNPAHSGYRKQCDACRGSGRVYVDRCIRCEGTGKAEAFRSIQVNVPPGIATGTRLHLKGLGARGGSGGRPGDFFVVVQVSKHPLLQLEDGRMVCRVPVPVYRALIGGKIDVPTLEGTVSLDVPAGVRSGHEIRLRGRGAYSQTGRRRGDLVVRLEVEMPKKITAAEKKILQQLADRAAAASYPQSKKYERVIDALQRKAAKKGA
jgi:molecular chaperone DnaJ